MVTTPIKSSAIASQFSDSPEPNPALEAPQTVWQIIEWVSKVLKISVMPECPIEAAKVWGEKSAKRPCYWDEGCQKVRVVSWLQFQEKRPTPSDLKNWWASSKTGVGCLGGFNGTHWISFADFDLKHFANAQDLEDQLAFWELKYSILANSLKFRSPSGGYRYIVAFSEKPENFGGNSGFTFTPGSSERLGELLTNNGGHTLLPPTKSYNGTYEWVRWFEYPPVVATPEDIGLYPVSKKTKESKPKVLDSSRSYTSGGIALDKLLCPSAQDVLNNGAAKGNRSDAIATLANEVLGWVNWLSANGIPFNGAPEELIQHTWSRMEDSASDPDKWQRCINSIAEGVLPAAHYKGGDEACWKKIRSVDRAIFEEKCPTCIKTALKVENRKAGTNNTTKSNKPVKFSGNPTSGDSANGSGNGSGDNGGFDGSGDDLRPEPNHWNAPVSWNGEIGWLVPTEKVVKETDPETGEETSVIDEKGKPVTEIVMVFFPKCDFDFQIEQELSSVDREDGGGIVLQVKRSIDSEQKRVIIKSVEYGSAKDFETALKKALGDGIVVNLKSDQLKSLIHVRLREYRERGGRKYRLCDRIGQQEDGTWVFENKQFTKDAQPTTQEESGWVYNPQVSPTDTFFCPKILDEDPKALRNLIEAQKKVAGSNFMRFLLCDGYVAACLNEQEIVEKEGFMFICNPYGDPGGLKTLGIDAALSLVWGTSDKSGMCSASESYLYERLSRYGSIPSLWDDPPSKRREDKERLDELIKRNYGKFARKVRGSDQHPHSSFIPTTNHATGDTLPATKSRGINLFFPVVQDANFEHQPELEEAKAKATGAFRQIISIGYDRTLVREVRARLQKHLPTAHDRAAIHLAILTWYTQKVVDLAGVGIDVEAWVIQNLCPELNEAQTGLNSITDFVERFIAAKSISAIGTWNFGLVKTAEQGNCLAIHMPSVWSVIESGDPPPYNRSVLERVLVEKGALKNKPAKLDRDRDSTQAYQREIHKGRNEGDGWIPPSKPKPVNKKCLLIPERLWGDLGFLLLVPDSPPDDDGDGGEGLVTSGNLEVTSSNLDEVTACKLEDSMVLAHSSESGNLVTKKYIEEEKKLVESGATQDDTKQQWDENSTDVWSEESEPLQNLVTGLLELVNELETTDNTEVESVTNEGYLEVTQGAKEVTSDAIASHTPVEIAPEATEVVADEVAPQSELQLIYEDAPTPTVTDCKLYRVRSEYYDGKYFENCTLVKRTQGVLSGWTFRTQEGELIRVYDLNHIEEMS
jgi:hypothetical protein